MFWQVELPIIVRHLINDLDDYPTYSDDRINQLIVVAASYVVKDVNLTNDKTYNINIVDPEISPDPCDPETRDTDFISFVALKTACLLDMATFRIKAINEGIKTSLGSANISINGNISGYKSILEIGPCSMYDQLVKEYNFGQANTIKAVLSPFVGNNFDPRYLLRGSYRPK
jgi:hypothetical protein